MDDAEFLTRFEACNLDHFPHRSHIRLACLYLDRYDEPDALDLLLAGLRRFAAAKGAADRFHNTMTRAWLELIVAARRDHPDARDVDALLAACPVLANPRALSLYYSDHVLSSAAARVGWVPPDRAPIAAAACAIGPTV
jgi:hypothetical protein